MLLALRLDAAGRAAGMTLAISAAPLNSERRDTSVAGTRAVVSSQQLMWDSPNPKLVSGAGPLQRGNVFILRDKRERTYHGGD